MKICSFESCERKAHARGLCTAHYQQQAKGQTLAPVLPYRGQRVSPATGPGTCCTIDGCTKTVHSGGLCSMHRWRVNNYGDPNYCETTRHLPMVERFWLKVHKGPGCWNWEGGGRDGYGTFTEGHKGKTHLAHRLAYELLVGPIPEGKLLDHRCRNTLCVNPKHLRVVTRKQNREHVEGAQRNSSTGALNVYRRKSGGYHVLVTHNGKPFRGGTFDDINEAAEAARQLRLSLFTHNDLDRRTA